jgi:hypothetical protein
VSQSSSHSRGEEPTVGAAVAVDEGDDEVLLHLGGSQCERTRRRAPSADHPSGPSPQPPASVGRIVAPAATPHTIAAAGAETRIALRTSSTLPLGALGAQRLVQRTSAGLPRTGPASVKSFAREALYVLPPLLWMTDGTTFAAASP